MSVAGRLPARQGRLLFGYLVLSRGRPARRDELLDVMWPDRAPGDADAALASVLARLRRVVGPQRLPPRGPVQLFLGADASVDVEEALEAAGVARRWLDAGRADEALQTASAALSILEQPLLPEFEGVWLDERRRQLQDVFGPLVDVAVEAGLELDDGALARAELIARRGVERGPFRESACAALMCVLARRGDTAEALRMFDELRVRLRDELGVAPSRTLLELHERLLSGEPVAGRAQVAQPRQLVRAPVPVPPFPLLGRDDDLERLRSDLDGAHGRLLTVVGPGGVGKTRLVAELARERMVEQPTAWVSLAPVSDAEDVASAIAHAVSISEGTGESIEEALVRMLSDQELLLVLDNFEHVLAAAPLVAELLAAASRLTALVTSREPLRLRAEQVVHVAPLALADPGAASPATELFLATAAARRPDLEFTADDMAAVVEICRGVDGLPLAIELAAGRLGLLSPRELAEQVHGGLDVLSDGARDAPQRQRTLRDTLEWSYRLLNASEQAAFAGLAVFAGGAAVVAARAVTGAGLATLEALEAKHLLTVTVGADGTRRLGTLETIRQFARERLSQRPDADAIARRHADHFLELAENAAPELRRRGPPDLFGRLDVELYNLRAAMTWGLEHGEPERCVRIAVALEDYWPKHSPAEGARWLTAGLEGAGDGLPAGLLARALMTLADRLSVTATMADAEAAARRAVDIARTTNDPAIAANALIGLAWVLMMRFREADAYPLALEAAALADASGDPELTADAQAALASCAPDIASARRAAEEAALHFEAAGNANRLLDLYSGLTYLALSLHDDVAAEDFHAREKAASQHAPVEREVACVYSNEGFLRLVRGDFAGARAAFSRQVTLALQQSIDELLPEALHGLAAVLAGEHHDERAAQLHGLAQRLDDEAVHPAIRRRLEPLYRGARSRLGARRWSTAVDAGRRLGPAEGIALAAIEER